MVEEIKSRRDFLKTSAAVFGVSLVGLNLPQVLLAAQEAEKNLQALAEYQHITGQEAVELAAIVDQIVPKDETPGASEIGVVYFIDAALGGFMAGSAPMIRQGLEELRQKTRSSHARVSHFSKLPFEQQTALIKSIEDTPFFAMIHRLTLCGMFSLPEYGGNREHAGWNLIGFNHQHAWQPPFGYYDAAVHNPTPKPGEDNEHS